MADALILRVQLPGKPRAWKRMQSAGKVRFSPKDQRTAKGVIQVHTIAAVNRLGVPWPIDWIYRVRIDAFWGLAKTKWRKKAPVPMAPRASVPDWDNLGKLVSDACEGILWHNDSQVVDGRVVKWTAKQGEAARTVVTIWALKPGAQWRDVIGRD